MNRPSPLRIVPAGCLALAALSLPLPVFVGGCGSSENRDGDSELADPAGIDGGTAVSDDDAGTSSVAGGSSISSSNSANTGSNANSNASVSSNSNSNTGDIVEDNGNANSAADTTPADGGLPCITCHSMPMGSRQAVVDASGTGGHRFGGELLTNDQCLFCHEITRHQQGSVRLWANPTKPDAVLVVEADPLRAAAKTDGLIAFCGACHAQDNHAIVQSDVGSAGQGGGSRVGCVNCHNPHLIKTASSLVDPDSGAVWTGAGEVFCLTCHDGAPPAGVSFPAGSSGTGLDKSSFAGTRHDAVGGGESCGHCHESHGSAYGSTLKGQYAVNDKNSYTAESYAACWLCHDENAVVFQENAFEGLHKKHVKDLKSPCIICHDAHRPFDLGETGLINFDYPVRSGAYDISFFDVWDGTPSFWLGEGASQGFCFIRCHGKDHKPKKYDRRPRSTTNCSACH